MVLLGGNLTCHSCFKSVHRDSCINFSPTRGLDIEHCTLDQQYCMVSYSILYCKLLCTVLNGKFIFYTVPYGKFIFYTVLYGKFNSILYCMVSLYSILYHMVSNSTVG